MLSEILKVREFMREGAGGSYKCAAEFVDSALDILALSLANRPIPQKILSIMADGKHGVHLCVFLRRTHPRCVPLKGINTDSGTDAGAASYLRAIIPKLHSFVADAAEPHVGLAIPGASPTGGPSKMARNIGTGPCLACLAVSKKAVSSTSIATVASSLS